MAVWLDWQEEKKYFEKNDNLWKGFVNLVDAVAELPREGDGREQQIDIFVFGFLFGWVLALLLGLPSGLTSI